MTLNKLKELQRKALEATIEFEVAREVFVKENCPHKVGDITEVQGYSHHGKKCKVYYICSAINYDGAIGYTIRAVLLRKDGTESRINASWQKFPKEWK